jgi:hypothetical protein
VAANTPPVPMANMGAQGEGRAVPQYGFRPSFVARPPAAGKRACRRGDLTPRWVSDVSIPQCHEHAAEALRDGFVGAPTSVNSGN